MTTFSISSLNVKVQLNYYHLSIFSKITAGNECMIIQQIFFTQTYMNFVENHLSNIFKIIQKIF